MFVLIAGGGNVGFSLARRLAGREHIVSLIESDPAVAQAIARVPGLLVTAGDACDPRVLEEANVRRADVVAAVTGDDEDNFVVCQLAKEVFRVRRTVARVNNSRNARAFAELGVDVPVDEPSVIATMIEEEVSFEEIATLTVFKRGKLSLVRIDLAGSSPAAGRKVSDLALPRESVLVSIVRGDEVVVPKGSTVLREGDDVIALTRVENEREMLRLLRGEAE